MSNSGEFVSVAAPTPLRTHFHYRVSQGQPARVGARVLVPFGNRKLAGIVTALNTIPNIDTSRIKNIIEVYDSSADVTPTIIKLCEWASDYYQHPVGEVFASALPSLVRQGWNPREAEDYLFITDEGKHLDPQFLNRAPAQKRALDALQEQPLLVSALVKLEISAATRKALVNKGWASWETREKPAMPFFELASVFDEKVVLTQEQTRAIDEINKSDSTRPATFLLHGITGSGKTEVYLRMIEPLLKKGLQVLVLIPEIGLTPQTVSRFQNRFDVGIIVLHSGLTDRERAQGWQQAQDGNAGIILGTRSAIFTPMKRPGAIIVDEEHDTSYKQQDGFRYSARDLAVMRAQIDKIPVVLGSATPSLESMHNVESGKYRYLQLNSRPPGAVAENYELVDTRHLEMREGFTRMLKARITEQLEAGQQVLLFINRRGYAPVMMCNDCNWIAQCRRCDSKLTYHLDHKTLVCHHCGTMSHNIISCQSCGNNSVSAIGFGTQRIEQTLTSLFPGYPILRIDRDSTRKKGSMQSFVDQIHTGEPAILVGTQLLAKGHHFPNITLVALLDIDAGFYSSDFRAVERLGQLVLQVGGRSGRADKPGTVIIQTAFASHPLLQTLINSGYRQFAAALLAERKEMELPPYAYNALIRSEAQNPALAREFLEKVVRGDQPIDSVNLLGPIPAMMEKKGGRYRQMVIISADSRQLVHRELQHRVKIIEALPDAKKIRWSIDVDPSDLF